MIIHKRSKFISIPKLSKLSGIRATVLRGLAEEGILPTWQNPERNIRARRARYQIPVILLAKWLEEHFKYSAGDAKTLIKELE